MSSTTRRLIAATAVAAAALFATGCGSDGVTSLLPENTGAESGAGDGSEAGDGGDGGEAAPPAEEPPAEAPPAEEPPAEQPPAEESPDGGTDDTGDTDDGLPSWLLPAVIIAAIVLLLAFVLGGRRRGTPAAPAATDPRRQTVATAQWVHDQLSLELLALAPTEAQQRWASQRGRLDQLSIEARTLAASGHPELWNQLASIIDALSSSLDTAVRVRATDGVDPSLVSEATTVVNRHRAELQAWLVNAGPNV